MNTTSSPSEPISNEPRIKIAVRLATGNFRKFFLPNYFGYRLMRIGEFAIYDCMEEICPEFKSGLWNCYELGNGGFYMAPQSPAAFDIHVRGNGFKARVSADAAGIIATAFALNRLSLQGAPAMDESYFKLLDYADAHPEGHAIFLAVN